MKKAVKRECARPRCGKKFLPTRENQLYCPGGVCRNRASQERLRERAKNSGLRETTI